MDRLQQKHRLYIGLGVLFGPLLRIIDNLDQYDEQDKAETLARYSSEYQVLTEEFRIFSQGQPGHSYFSQYAQFQNALMHMLQAGQVDESFASRLRNDFSVAQAAIDAVPVPRTSVILEAGSPFTSYRKLLELCEVEATKALVWLDPFFAASIFDRYIGSVRLSVPVTLVTVEPGSNAGKRDTDRWNALLDVSRLYAQERGPTLYRLVVQPNLHDRWVMFDDKRIYALGGSAKDAGDKDYFTIASVESSAENLKKIQTQIDTGAEYFGQQSPQHR